MPIGVLALKRGAVRHIATSREEKGIAPLTKKKSSRVKGAVFFLLFQDSITQTVGRAGECRLEMTSLRALVTSPLCK